MFECGANEGVGQVMEMFRQLRSDPALSKGFRIGSLSFSCKDVVPLQAADILAYEVFKQVENQVVDQGKKPDGTPRHVRISVKGLVRPEDISYLQYWDRAGLGDWIADAERQGVMARLRMTLA
ncbi:MAG: hypothetical protein ACREQN_14170 [Candidatus Binataceae bacterium]